MTSSKRHTPSFPLPAYRYTPGKDPKDEDRADIPKFKFEKLRENNWKTNEAYLYGIDLFNHAFYFEAHEVWEELWFETGRERPEGSFLKALIQLSGAQLKMKMKEENPAGRLFTLACKTFENLPSPFLGLDIEKLLKLGIEKATELKLVSPA